MARTVTDAAILLGILSGKDEEDPATWKIPQSTIDYTTCLDLKGLRNANIGIFRKAPITRYRDHDEYDELLFENAVTQIKEAGANIIEDIDIPSFDQKWGWNKLNNEFKHNVEHYLQSLPSHLPVHTLSELIEWNKQNAERALKYGLNLLEYREQLNNPLNNSNYILELITDLYHSQNNGIDYAVHTFGLDAIVFPSYVGADLSARAGYPSIAVPAGYKENGRPFGITFAGKAFTESVLIRIAYAFEQLTVHRKKPNL